MRLSIRHLNSLVLTGSFESAHTNEWEMRQCCPGNILDGIRTYSIIKRDFTRRRPTQDLAGLFGVLQLLRPRVSGDCLGNWKLIPCGISTLTALRQAIITTQHMIFVSTTPNSWTLSTALLDISRMITGSSALLCINSALSLSSLRGFLQHFLRAFFPSVWSASLWGGQDIQGTKHI
jgi:hypothetical protein